MQPDIIVLFCDNSTHKKSMWVTLAREEVVITLDLKMDEYVFSATCPYCKDDILNTRSAFR